MNLHRVLSMLNVKKLTDQCVIEYIPLLFNIPLPTIWPMEMPLVRGAKGM